MCVVGVTSCTNALKLELNDNLAILVFSKSILRFFKAHSGFENLTSRGNMFQSLEDEQENAPLYIVVRANGVYKVPFCPGTILSWL